MSRSKRRRILRHYENDTEDSHSAHTVKLLQRTLTRARHTQTHCESGRRDAKIFNAAMLSVATTPTTNKSTYLCDGVVGAKAENSDFALCSVL